MTLKIRYKGYKSILVNYVKKQRSQITNIILKPFCILSRPNEKERKKPQVKQRRGALASVAGAWSLSRATFFLAPTTSERLNRRLRSTSMPGRVEISAFCLLVLIFCTDCLSVL